jgi:hypothetical protein
MPALAKLFV